MPGVHGSVATAGGESMAFLRSSADLSGWCEHDPMDVVLTAPTWCGTSFSMFRELTALLAHNRCAP